MYDMAGGDKGYGGAGNDTANSDGGDTFVQ